MRGAPSSPPAVPFTLAHPVLVIPLRRRADLTALVIGSMVPDLGHLIGVDLDRGITHDPLIWPLFCVPTAWLLYLLYTRLLRAPLLSLAPQGLVLRLPAPAASPGWRSVLLGLLIGAGSHIAFDTATTVNFRYDWAGPLLRPFISIAGIGINVQDLLRHGSAVLGMALIGLWAWRWWQRTPPQADLSQLAGHLPLRPALRLAIIVAASLLVLAAAVLGSLAEDGLSVRHRIGHVVRAALPLASATLIIYALGWQIWRLFAAPPGRD